MFQTFIACVVHKMDFLVCLVKYIQYTILKGPFLAPLVTWLHAILKGSGVVDTKRTYTVSK